MISPNHIAKVANGLIMKRQAEDGDPDAPQISATATFIFILTMIVFSLIFAAIAYTYDNLIVTLCMVESSSTNTYVPIQAVEPTGDEPPAYSEDGILGTTGSEINIVRTQPITASLRATVRHLRARAGFRSLFRGLSVFLVWNFAASFIVGLFSGATNNLFVAFVASIFAQLALVSASHVYINLETLILPVGKRPHDLDSRCHQRAIYKAMVSSYAVSFFPSLEKDCTSRCYLGSL